MSRPSRFVAWAILTLAIATVTPAVQAQDLYDTTVLRTLSFTFHDADWLNRLRQNYESGQNILADLVVDGVTYPDVGVRIRGNTSYFLLPAGSEKFSLNVELDFVHADQDLLGYDSLNLNNGFRDPTFCREVVYNNYVAQFIPNPRANHVVVTLNGQNWGVYVNVQQFDKTLLSSSFTNPNGLRIKCANNPNGPGLRYNGTDSTWYAARYEIKNRGGLANPWGSLIEVCNAVTNGSLSNWALMDELFAVDPSIWSVALENLLTDDDSYINKGADFMTYRDPVDGRTFLLQTDANETFTQDRWSPTLNFGSTSKPVLSHVLAVAELRQRYMDHYRTVMANLDWAYFEPIFTAHRNLIDAAVQADPKKLYSYQLFLNNFTQTVVMPYPGVPGGPIIGIREFVDGRAAYLGGNAELNAAGPVIESVTASNETPAPGETVTIAAQLPASGVSQVVLFYRPTPDIPFERRAMTAQGGGVWSVALPVVGVAGQEVDYYVMAVATNSYQSQSYFPLRVEWDPATIKFEIAASDGLRITEWMYSGASGEFVEFTNTSQTPIDLTGWSFDDSHAIPGAFDLSPLGVVDPGESVIITESVAETFRTVWGLDAGVAVLGGLGVVTGNNLGRNDELNVYDETGTLVDRLTYGDESFPGTIRTQNASGQACCQFIGVNDITGWQLSSPGDLFGSYTATTGDVGTPGFYDPSLCEGCGVSAIDDGGAALSGLWFAPASPNPFAFSTELRLRLSTDERVTIEIFDAIGRRVRSLVDGSYSAGEHVVAWDGNDDRGAPVLTGTYFARLDAGARTSTQKIIRLR